jgi:hypothetical protein
MTNERLSPSGRELASTGSHVAMIAGSPAIRPHALGVQRRS